MEIRRFQNQVEQKIDKLHDQIDELTEFEVCITTSLIMLCIPLHMDTSIIAMYFPLPTIEKV